MDLDVGYPIERFPNQKSKIGIEHSSESEDGIFAKCAFRSPARSGKIAFGWGVGLLVALGTLLGVLGTSWGACGRSWVLFGHSWNVLSRSWVFWGSK